MWTMFWQIIHSFREKVLRNIFQFSNNYYLLCEFFLMGFFPSSLIWHRLLDDGCEHDLSSTVRYCNVVMCAVQVKVISIFITNTNFKRKQRGKEFFILKSNSNRDKWIHCGMMNPLIFMTFYVFQTSVRYFEVHHRTMLTLPNRTLAGNPVFMSSLNLFFFFLSFSYFVEVFCLYNYCWDVEDNEIKKEKERRNFSRTWIKSFWYFSLFLFALVSVGATKCWNLRGLLWKIVREIFMKSENWRSENVHVASPRLLRVSFHDKVVIKYKSKWFCCDSKWSGWCFEIGDFSSVDTQHGFSSFLQWYDVA